MTPPPPPPPAFDEPSLIAAAQAGDRQALDQLLREHQAAIHAVCRRIAGNDTDALDATQDAMIAVVRGLPRFDGRSKFSTWVYRIATNACLDELRRRRRRPVVGLPEHDGVEMDLARTDVTSVADRVTDGLVVADALASLPEEFRAAVVLRDMCELDYAEIGEVLEIPAGTVRSRIARGRAQLIDRLSGNRTDPTERPTSAS